MVDIDLREVLDYTTKHKYFWVAFAFPIARPFDHLFGLIFLLDMANIFDGKTTILADFDERGII